MDQTEPYTFDRGIFDSSERRIFLLLKSQWNESRSFWRNVPLSFNSFSKREEVI